MLSLCQILIMVTLQNKVILTKWNFKNNTVNKLQINKLNPEQKCKMYVFENTRKIAILYKQNQQSQQECQKQMDYVYTIKYLYAGKKDSSKSMQEQGHQKIRYIATETLKMPISYRFRKVDNNSSLAIFPSKMEQHSPCFPLTTISLFKNSQSTKYQIKISLYNIVHGLPVKRQSNLTSKISDIWLADKQKLYIQMCTLVLTKDDMRVVCKNFQDRQYLQRVRNCEQYLDYFYYFDRNEVIRILQNQKAQIRDKNKIIENKDLRKVPHRIQFLQNIRSSVPFRYEQQHNLVKRISPNIHLTGVSINYYYNIDRIPVVFYCLERVRIIAKLAYNKTCYSYYIWNVISPQTFMQIDIQHNSNSFTYQVWKLPFQIFYKINIITAWFLSQIISQVEQDLMFFTCQLIEEEFKVKNNLEQNRVVFRFQKLQEEKLNNI